MTLKLRKIHRYSWFLLAVLLPLGWLAAIRAIPDAVYQNPVRASQPEPLPIVTQSKQSGDFLFNLRQDSLARRNQIEIIISKPLENPNTTVLVGLDDPATVHTETLLGLIGNRGVWRFELDSVVAKSNTFSLIMEDRIKGVPLRTVAFSR
ncbi:MAG: hypothetical protein WCR52_21395 [Bacteroidota bacterium]